jgi:hypothetical protein
MPNFEPWMRNYNYSKDYFSFLFNQYAGQYVIAYPCDYYSLDYENSVKENEYLIAGSYEKYGVGELSGYVWKKIYSLPVYGVDAINPQYDSSDQGGLTLRQSLNGQLVVPDITTQYPQYITLACNNSKTALLDNLKEGDMVIVEININGKLSSKDENKAFNNLVAYQIKKE